MLLTRISPRQSALDRKDKLMRRIKMRTFVCAVLCAGAYLFITCLTGTAIAAEQPDMQQILKKLDEVIQRNNDLAKQNEELAKKVQKLEKQVTGGLRRLRESNATMKSAS